MRAIERERERENWRGKHERKRRKEKREKDRKGKIMRKKCDQKDYKKFQYILGSISRWRSKKSD